MGGDLQCSRIAFLAVVNVFDVLILSGSTLKQHHTQLLFFAFVDLPTAVRSLRVRLLVEMAFSCLFWWASIK
jgi:hypothetical protein